MNEDQKDELREWIRENLILETSFAGDGNSNDMQVSLRFFGDDEPFVYDVISIPEQA